MNTCFWTIENLMAPLEARMSNKSSNKFSIISRYRMYSLQRSTLLATGPINWTIKEKYLNASCMRAH